MFASEEISSSVIVNPPISTRFKFLNSSTVPPNVIGVEPSVMSFDYIMPDADKKLLASIPVVDKPVMCPN